MVGRYELRCQALQPLVTSAKLLKVGNSENSFHCRGGAETGGRELYPEPAHTTLICPPPFGAPPTCHGSSAMDEHRLSAVRQAVPPHSSHAVESSHMMRHTPPRCSDCIVLRLPCWLCLGTGYGPLWNDFAAADTGTVWTPATRRNAHRLSHNTGRQGLIPCNVFSHTSRPL